MSQCSEVAAVAETQTSVAGLGVEPVPTNRSRSGISAASDLGHQPGRAGRHLQEVDVDLAEVVVGVGVGRVLGRASRSSIVGLHEAARPSR